MGEGGGRKESGRRRGLGSFGAGQRPRALGGAVGTMFGLTHGRTARGGRAHADHGASAGFVTTADEELGLETEDRLGHGIPFMVGVGADVWC